MSRILRSIICLALFFAAGSAFAASYVCDTRRYTQCNDGYYLSDCGTKRDGSPILTTVAGNTCLPCPEGYKCEGINANCPKADAITVTLNHNGGTGTLLYNTITYNPGSNTWSYGNQTITTVPVPTRSGYTFTGYYTAPQTSITPTATVSTSGGTVTLADVAVGEGSSEETIEDGGGVDVPLAVDQRIDATGKILSSWKPSGAITADAYWCTTCSKGTGVASCGTKPNNDTTCTYVATCSSGYGNPTCDKDGKCTCEKIVFEITLNDSTNGGSGGSGKIYYKQNAPTSTGDTAVRTGGTWYSDANTTTQITSVKIPTKTGATFTGYFSRASDSGDAFTLPLIPETGTLPTSTKVGAFVPSADMTLYARFVDCTECTKGTGVASCTATVTDNTCSGWTAVCLSGYGNPTCDENGKCTCQASNITITLDPNGGTFGTMANTRTCVHGTACTLPKYAATENPSTGDGIITKAESVFLGWADDDKATEPTYTNSQGTFTESKTLYAVWGDPRCGMPASVLEQINPVRDAVKSIENNTLRCDVTCTNGFSKLGGSDTTASFTNYGIPGSASYVMNDCLPRVYTITLDFAANGGTGGTAAIYEKYNTGWYTTSEATAKITSVTPPTKAGHTFTGYWTDATGGTNVIPANGSLSGIANTKYTADTTLYAQFTPDTYTITLDANGGTFGSMKTSVTCTYGVACTLPKYAANANATTGDGTITKDNSVFLGWAEANDATSPTYANNQGSFTGDKTIFAVWGTPTCGTITGGTQSSVSVSSNKPQCNITCSTGYSRNGGTNTTNTKTCAGTAGSAAAVDCSCSPRTFTVAFNLNEGSGTKPNSVTATYDADMPTLSTTTAPTRTGYTFMGWYDNKTYTSGTQYYTAAGASATKWNKAANTTLYAGWKINSYNCTSGQYLPAGATECVLCLAGNKCPSSDVTYTYNADAAQGLTPCSGVNEWQDQTGQTTCKPVTDGMIKKSDSELEDCGKDNWCKAGVKTACTANSTTGTVTTASAITSCSCQDGFGGDAATSGGTCTKCDGGTYKAGVGNTTCNDCGDGYYCSGGSNRTACPTANSGWTAHTTSVNATTYSACYETQTPDHCVSGTVKRAASSATAYSATIEPNETLKADMGYYAATTATSCSECATGTYSDKTGATSCSSCSTLTPAPTVTGGDYSTVPASAATAATACRYTPKAHAAVTGCLFASNTVEWNGSKWTDNYYTVTANSGYKVENNNSATATCSPCGNGNYGGGGNATICGACSELSGIPSGVTGTYSTVSSGTTTTTTATAATACRFTPNSISVPANCATVKANTVAYASGAWAQNFYTVTSASGNYITANDNASPTCAACSALTKPNGWPTGGTYSSAANATAATACRFKPAAKTIDGCSTVTANTVEYKSSGWDTGIYTVKADKGYKVATATGLAPSCSACDNGTFNATVDSTATTCSSCPATAAGSDGARDSNATCYISCSAKTISNGTTTVVNAKEYYNGSKYPACTFNVNCNATYGASGDQTENPACSPCDDGQYSAGGANACAACTNLKSNAHYTSNGSSATSCKYTCDDGYKGVTNATTGTCSVCGDASYCTGGAAKSCPTADSGWTAHTTSTTAASYSACYENKTDKQISDYCAKGELRRTASSASAYSTTATIQTALEAEPGSIVSGQTCSQCSGAVFSAGGKVTSCSSCPTQTSGWTRATGDGWTKYSDCYETQTPDGCSAGTVKHVASSASAWATATSLVSKLTAKANYYASAADVVCHGCPGGYPNSGAGSTLITQCYSDMRTRPWSGSQVDPTKPTGCATMTTGTCSADTKCQYDVYSNAAGTGDGAHKSGCTTNSDNCTKPITALTANANYYVNGTTSCPACSSIAGGFYPNSAAGNSGGAKGVCKTDSLSGQYVASANATSATNCAENTWKGSHQVAYGSTSSCTPCPTGYGVASGAGTAEDSCAITCAGGSYLKTAKDASCTNVGEGYWAASQSVNYGSTSTRNQCAAGLKTRGFGPGADEAGDCGRILHAGGNDIYLRSDKKTTPSLNVNVGGATYYGNMSTESKSGLKILYKDAPYSVYDDGM